TGVPPRALAQAPPDDRPPPTTRHPPLVVHGALLMEPTETESKETLDGFVASVRGLAEKAKAGGAAEQFKASPAHTPRRRLDETTAARTPMLRWKPAAEKRAAE
ncbi:MAG: aminomethyl-transferring glycine dehydrogenase subunit GcvPB, partial [Rhodospirillales bacterium]|nr:aminomethyl-transferring glycine dehydrogenase subunit GcvPB [Rhodospirillales bacterium]